MAAFAADSIVEPPPTGEVVSYQPIMSSQYQPPEWGQLWPRGDGFGG